jgi:hypothetical protein
MREVVRELLLHVFGEKNPKSAKGNASDWIHCPKRRSPMPAHAKTGTDASEALRDVGEKSAALARENFETMSAAAGEATNLLKHNYATTQKGTQDYSAKVLELANANISAAVEQATKLANVKSPMEFFALSNDYAKRQFEVFTRQVQELAAIVQKMTITRDR